MQSKFYYFFFVILIGLFRNITTNNLDEKSQAEMYQDIIKHVQSKKIIEENNIEAIKFLQIEDVDKYLEEKKERRLQQDDIYFPQLNLKKLHNIHIDSLSSNVNLNQRELSNGENKSNQENNPQNSQENIAEKNDSKDESVQAQNNSQESVEENIQEQKELQIKEHMKKQLLEQVKEKLDPLCYQLKKISYSHFHKEICVLQISEKVLLGYIFELSFGFLPYSPDAIVMTIHQGIASPKAEDSEHESQEKSVHQSSQENKSKQEESHEEQESQQEEIPFEIENQPLEEKDLEYYNDYSVFKDFFYIIQKQLPVLKRFHYGYINKESQCFYLSTDNHDEKVKEKEDKNDHKLLEEIFKSKKKLHYRIFDAQIKNKDTNVETDELVIMVSNHEKGLKKFDEVKNESLVKNKLQEIVEKLKEVNGERILLQLIQTINH